MRKYLTLSILLLAAVGVNSFYLKIPAAGPVLMVVYALYYGDKLGRLILPRLDRFWAVLFGPLFLFSAVSLLGGGVYYLYRLNEPALAALTAALPLLLILAAKKIPPPTPDAEKNLEKVEIVLPTVSPVNRLAWLVWLIDGALFYHLVTHSTSEAIRSPWLVISPNFFLAFALATLLLILFLKNTKRAFFALCTVFIHSLLLLSVALIIYQLGYGFDPFIHRAAENYLVQFGEILPKTPYYIGQYALVVWLQKISLLPLDLIDKWLLPLFEALWLPPLIFLMLRQGLKTEAWLARLGALFFWLLPFAGLIATTPQDLANFYALAFILWSALYLTSDLISAWPIIMLALAALITHPLIGLPIITAAALFILIHYSPKQQLLRYLKTAAASLFILGAVLILPAISLLYANLKSDLPPLALPKTSELLARLPALPPLPQPRPHFSASVVWTTLYYYQYLLPVLYLAVALFGFFNLIKHYRRLALSSLGFWLIFWLNIVLLKIGIIFPQVINYEQSQYADRLAQFSYYILMPLFLYGLLKIFHHLTIKHKFLSVVAAAGLLTASFYLSYPRVDPYAFSRTFNVSAADLESVAKIEALAGGEDYVVLSNQILAAAALQKYGFKKYYQTARGELFYYALPTGGPLYAYYQKMVYANPSRETAEEVMKLTGVSQVYLAVNDYWNSFPTVVPLAKQSADEWWEIADGKVLIFKYTRK